MSEPKKFLLLVLPFLLPPGIYYLRLLTGGDVSLFYGILFWAGVIVFAVFGIGTQKEGKFRLSVGRKLNIALHLAVNSAFWVAIAVHAISFRSILGPSIAGRVLFLLALVGAATYALWWGAVWLSVAVGRPPAWIDVNPVLAGGPCDGDPD